jgi:hypothetical protein
VGTLGYSGDKVLSVRPYSPPPSGSAPDLKFRRCFGNDSCQFSMQPEREVDPPSSIRHQSHLMPFVEIMPKRQQHTTQCRQAPASRLRTSARVPSADAVRGSMSQLRVLFQDRAFECSTFSENPSPSTQVQPGFNVWVLGAPCCHGQTSADHNQYTCFSTHMTSQASWIDDRAVEHAGRPDPATSGRSVSSAWPVS